MLNKTYNIDTCTINDQINIVFKGALLKPASAYLEDQLKHALDTQHAEIVLNMKDLKYITGQCVQVVHDLLSKTYTTKKIVIICRNDSQVESLLLHLGFAQWFSFFSDEEQLTKVSDSDISTEDTDIDKIDEAALLKIAA